MCTYAAILTGSLCLCLFYFRSLVCDGKRGLLTRLLQVMKKEPAESSFRWVWGQAPVTLEGPRSHVFLKWLEIPPLGTSFHSNIWLL